MKYWYATSHLGFILSMPKIPPYEGNGADRSISHVRKFLVKTMDRLRT